MKNNISKNKIAYAAMAVLFSAAILITLHTTALNYGAHMHDAYCQEHSHKAR